MGLNTYLENYSVISQFNVQKVPSVISLKDGQIIERFESSYTQPDINNGRLGWQDEH